MGRHHDLVDFTKRYKAELHEFYLDISSWRRFRSDHALTWQRVKFGTDSLSDVPEVRGLYVVTVALDISLLPQHGYILYVGMTGNDGEANLRRRYAQYLRHLANNEGRPAVAYMLTNWHEDLFFNFAPLADVRADLIQIERSFINSIIPPVNKRDFDADLAAGRAAAF